MIVHRDTGEYFDLKLDVAISFVRKAFWGLNTAGGSLPFNLPFTEKNARLLNNPNRIDILRDENASNGHAVIIMSSAFQKEATLRVIDADRKKGFECSLSIEDGIHTSFAEKKMPDVFNDFVIRKNSLDELIDYLQSLMQGSYEDHGISVFCVAGMFPSIETPIPLNKHRYIVENPTAGNVYQPSLEAYENGVFHTKNEDRLISISCPKGFLCTPFLKLRTALEYIFSQQGLTLDCSDYTTGATWLNIDDIVILHNTADAIITSEQDQGKLFVRRLVPTCTVAEFLKSVMALLGAGLFPDGKGNVFLRSWSSILDLREAKQEIKPIDDLSIKPVNASTLSLSIKYNDKELTYTPTKDLSELKIENSLSYYYERHVHAPFMRTGDVISISTEGMFPLAGIGSLRLVNSEININGTTIGGEGIDPCPIMFCKRASEVVNLYNNVTEDKILYDRYPDENQLTPHAAFYFYKGSYLSNPNPVNVYNKTSFYSLNEMVRKNGFEVTIKPDISPIEGQTFRMDIPRILNGQPVIAIESRFTLKQEGTSIDSMIFRTIPYRIPT